MRARIIRRAIQLRRDVEMIFNDAAHWNRIHPDEQIDPDPDGSLRRLAKGLDHMLLREKVRLAR